MGIRNFFFCRFSRSLSFYCPSNFTRFNFLAVNTFIKSYTLKWIVNINTVKSQCLKIVFIFTLIFPFTNQALQLVLFWLCRIKTSYFLTTLILFFVFRLFQCLWVLSLSYELIPQNRSRKREITKSRETLKSVTRSKAFDSLNSN